LKPESIRSFVTDYIASLFERSRLEKQSIKFGLDWIIYNFGIAQNWRPVRLPFVRQVGELAPKAKTEAEFGIDVSFLRSDLKELVIFVLKDEPLNNKNWTGQNFDVDLRKAEYPDLGDPVFSTLDSVRLILAYNKDDDQVGVGLFDRLVANAPRTSKRNDGLEIPLSIERWNLDRLVDEVSTYLLSPQILPQHISGLLAYVCELNSRIEFGSQEWETLVVPTWRSFLNTALADPVDERKLRAVPISLIILKQFQNPSDPSSAAGWIDLLEWAMLALWMASRKTDDKRQKQIVYEAWIQMYVAELEMYISASAEVLTTQHGIVGQRRAFGKLNPVNDANKAFWIMARMGISSIATPEIIDLQAEKAPELIEAFLNRYADILQKALRQNPAFLRPLIDVHHIELFFIWLIFWRTARLDEIEYFLNELEARLFFRRVGSADLPFVDGRNQLDLVAEYAATGEKPYGFTEESSYLLLMLLELSFSLPQPKRDHWVMRAFNRLVMGIDINGEKYFNKHSNQETQPITLCWWAPPDNWAERILTNKVVDGVSVAFTDLPHVPNTGADICDQLSKFMEATRKNFPFKPNVDLPFAVFLLACVKHQSPLPSELWRAQIFPEAASREHPTPA
jgi:hypothetical protein